MIYPLEEYYPIVRKEVRKGQFDGLINVLNILIYIDQEPLKTCPLTCLNLLPLMERALSASPQLITTTRKVIDVFRTYNLLAHPELPNNLILETKEGEFVTNRSLWRLYCGEVKTPETKKNLVIIEHWLKTGCLLTDGLDLKTVAEVYTFAEDIHALDLKNELKDWIKVHVDIVQDTVLLDFAALFDDHGEFVLAAIMKYLPSGTKELEYGKLMSYKNPQIRQLLIEHLQILFTPDTLTSSIWDIIKSSSPELRKIDSVAYAVSSDNLKSVMAHVDILSNHLNLENVTLIFSESITKDEIKVFKLRKPIPLQCKMPNGEYITVY